MTGVQTCALPILLSKDEYFDAAYKDIIGDASHSSLIASLISAETDPAKLEKFREMIDKRKAEIEGR